MRRGKSNPKLDFTVGILMLSIFIGCLAGWINHVVWTFQQETVVSMLLGGIGALVAPVGVIHGLVLWF